MPRLHDEAGTKASQNQASASKRPSSSASNDPPDPDKPYCILCGGAHSQEHCPKRKRTGFKRCFICNKVGHKARQCHKRNYCFYCMSNGHLERACMDPHCFCSPTRRCPVPSYHRFARCTESSAAEDYSYNDYDFDIDWEAQDHGD
jgi:hypothetical protein